MNPSKRSIIFSIFFFLFCFAAISTSAWNYRGHMLTAAIAWENLSPSEKTAALEILKNHPDYAQKWKPKYDADYQGRIPLGQYLMMEASTWPDVIRNKENPNHHWHRGFWHFINYQVRFPDQHVTEDVNGDDPDVLWAIDNALKEIGQNQSAEEKAIYFAWMLHLVGDLHQPLHAAALFDDGDFQEGDRGGNWFYVIAKKDTLNLHYYWDGIGGRNLKLTRIVNEAKKLSSTQKNFDQATLQQTNMQAVCMESFELAVSTVYLNGTLKGGKKPDMVAPLPKSYSKDAKKAGMERITLAGIRISQVIKTNIPG